MNDKGFNVVAYNRTTSKVDAFLANEAKGLSSYSGVLILFFFDA
jgi:6-phosphogluconate dehydrogenase